MHRGQNNHPALHVFRLQCARQIERGDLTFVFVAMITRGKQHRRAAAVGHHHDRNGDRAPAGIVARLRHPQHAELFARFGVIDFDDDARFIGVDSAVHASLQR